MEIDKTKIGTLLDLLRLKLIQQRTLTEEITKIYQDINELAGSPIDVPLDQKTKAKKGWGPQEGFATPPATPESQTLRDHVLSREF